MAKKRKGVKEVLRDILNMGDCQWLGASSTDGSDDDDEAYLVIKLDDLLDYAESEFDFEL